VLRIEPKAVLARRRFHRQKAHLVLSALRHRAEPVGGRWNLDHDNREPPPSDGRLAVPEPWWPEEDEIDERVRADLDRWPTDGDVAFVGDDGPRLFPATRR
jgi:deoxyribodipyrimidine photolyase-like uncharacterized protein